MAHGHRAAVRGRPSSLTASGACHSMLPIGTRIAHSAPPSGTKADICAVVKKCSATRCCRLARPSRTRRHRVARSGFAGPAPATSRIFRRVPQVMYKHLRRGGEASSDALSPRKRGQVSGWHHRSRSFWGRPIPAVEWVCKACHGAGPTCGGAKHTCHGAGPMLVLHC